MNRVVAGNLTAGKFIKALWQEINDDKLVNRAAELGYYFTLALFPLLIFLITVLGLIPGAPDIILEYLARVIPGQAMEIVDTWVRTIFSRGGSGLLSLSLVFTLWSASSGMVALLEVLNDAYNVAEGRPFWKSRLVAVVLTVALALLVIGGVVLLTFGSEIIAWLTRFLGLASYAEMIGNLLNYAVGLAMLFFGLDLIYYYGPNVRQRWRWLMPGTIFSVVTILLVSYLFSLYLRFAPSYDAVYGSLGAVIVLMIWLYLMSLLIMIGGEINDVTDKAAGRRIVEKERAKAE